MFAARCARRVLPLFQQAWPDAPNEASLTVQRAVELAEHAAGSRDTNDLSTVSQNAVRNIRNIACAALRVTPATHRSAIAVAVANAAAEAAAATQAAAGFASSGVSGCHASNAANFAVSAAAGFHAEDQIRRDFERLKEWATAENIDEYAVVTSEVFGPLWPDGPPPRWPSMGPSVQSEVSSLPVHPLDDESFALIIRARSKPDVTSATIRKHLVELYKALNEYSLEKYGRRLTRDQFRRLVFKHAGVTV